ncbi:DUF1565 domain-containing protein [Halostella salina]|uniref:DUF1565 domain-containing protein n=1 Tax=Halostella salina TaxID=1547897 RepID=UPI000EF7EC4A|nr:DUF1565 domain-containing protein [Halostella salina]
MNQRVSRRQLLATAVAGTLGGCQGASPTGTTADTTTSGTTGTAQTPTSAADSERTDDDRSAVLHVSLDGDDANPGTEAKPLASIQTALDRAGPGETVYVHPGEYYEYVRIQDGGEPDAPLTLTGPPDAVLKPPRDNEWEALGVDASYVHITGLTFSGLYNPDEPEQAESYAPTHLIFLNSSAAEVGYIEGLVVSPHRIGHAGGALINSKRIKNSEIGGFKVIGPAGAYWLFSERDGHYGEVVYLGTAADNLARRGNFEDYDHTRNVRVHHIDNSEGHPHAELVDCKEGTRNITVEYCTDAGGVQSDDSFYSRSVSLGGRDCTVRWNVIRNAKGTAVGIGPVAFLSDPGTYLAEPQTETERQMGTGHAIYGNVFTGNRSDAVDLLRASARPGRDSNPLPSDQRAICGNLFDGYTDAAPGSSCPSGLPTSDGVGHLGGDSPWEGTPPTKEAAFSGHRTAPNLDVSVSAADVPAETEIEATITVTNTGDSAERVVFRLRHVGYKLADRTVTVPAGETEEVRFSVGGLAAPKELAITRNGQKIGRIHVVDGG